MNNILKWCAIIFVGIILAGLYKTYNPIESNFFPKCPFKVVTGLKCPGCGSQRAVHHLLNFDILKAAEQNVLLVLSLPYILLGLTFDSLKNPSESLVVWRNRLFGYRAIIIVLVVVIGFWIVRNIVSI